MRPAFLTVILFVIFLSLGVASTEASVSVPTSVAFGFGSGSYVTFSEEKSFSAVYRESGYWYFDGYGFNLANVNVTVSTFFFHDKLIFACTVEADSTGTANIYLGQGMIPNSVSGASKWSFDRASRLLSVSMPYSSQVIVSWAEGGGGPPPPQDGRPVGFFQKNGVRFLAGLVVAVIIYTAFVKTKKTNARDRLRRSLK